MGVEAQSRTTTEEQQPDRRAQNPDGAQPTQELPANYGGTQGMPRHPTAHLLRRALIQRLQRNLGNQHAQGALSSVLQRDDGGAPAADAATAPAAARPTFSAVRFEASGDRFDAAYTPVGPTPEVGELEIQLWVHITFKDFTRAMMRQEPFRAHRFTREQIADFAWTADERAKFETDFMSSVQSAWSGQHMLKLNDPSFSEYRARVNVSVISVDSADTAHTKITAQKVPRGAPRFRSFVSGDEATLDIRDPSEPEEHQVGDRKIVRQIKPFDLDSADLTGTVETQTTELVAEMRRKGVTLGTNAAGENWQMAFVGHASSRGERAYNQRLGQRRAEAVKARVESGFGSVGDDPLVASVGETNASTDERFQRVDVSVRNRNPTTVTQNVAAHEAGHMFGLGDEYVEERPTDGAIPKFFGDQPEHYGDVEAQLGTEAADDLLVQDGGSMMSSGGQVKAGHYVYFLQMLESMTGKQWTVES
jgi:outer membrane protein OmpA-like peptidoglycan-associated protein